MNRVDLYSNGTAVIRRAYPLAGEPLPIRIPVRKADLADVVSSLAVFGDVSLPEPPSYAPVNAVTTRLSIDPQSALRDLATKLAGARVRVERPGGAPAEGRLVGVHPYKERRDGLTLDMVRVVVLTEAGVVSVPEEQVAALRFLDDAVRAEVGKALDAAYGTIRPDGATVELTVVPKPGAERCLISYAVPAAAWKIRYHLNLTKEKPATLAGQAVVDNDTDDDWADAVVSVITGEPITFDTDLAEVRRPGRERVNVVADRAAGAVVMEPEFVRYAMPAAPPSLGPGGRVDVIDTQFGSRAKVHHGRSVDSLMMDFTPAEQEQAEARDSGDFTVFTSPGPVTVRAHTSAILPMFTAEPGPADEVLVYKHASDAARPFRAVRLKNGTPTAWGKGVAEVYRDGDFQGKCVLDGYKPGEEAFLVYAKETGVRVHRDAKREESQWSALRFHEGTAFLSTRRRRDTAYRAVNARPEAFTLEIEHPRQLPDATLAVDADGAAATVVETPSGWRVGVPLPANGAVRLTLTERRVDATEYAVGDGVEGWLLDTMVQTKNPLTKHPELKKLVALQKEVGAAERRYRDADKLVSTIEKAQERLLKLIPAAHADQASAWKSELGANEAELRELERTKVPALKEEWSEAKAKVRAAARALAAEWAE